MAIRLTAEQVRRAAAWGFSKEDLMSLAIELERVGGGEPLLPSVEDYERDGSLLGLLTANMPARPIRRPGDGSPSRN